MKALQQKWIAIVALGVYWEKPANPEDPLFQFDNLVAMPHIADSSEESQERMVEIVVGNIVRIAERKKPINIQD